MSDRNLQYVHAGAVGNKNGGILLVGKGGSGKSSTALACLKSDFTKYHIAITKNWSSGFSKNV